MTDIRQSHRWQEYLESLGWKTEKIEDIYISYKKLPLIDSIIKIQRPENLPIRKILEFTKKKSEPNDPGSLKAFIIKIEPKDELQAKILVNNEFKLSKTPLSPSKTVVLDLKKTEKQLLSEMHHKTRYNIKIAQKKEVTIEIPKPNDPGSLEKFSKIWLENQKRKKIPFSSTSQIEKFWEIFKEDSCLILAKGKNGEVLAGILMPVFEKTAYYLYAGATKEGQKLFAPTKVAWEALRLAKQKGCTKFDFEGIYDERFPGATSGWQGFSRFKKSFGGKEVEHPGAYVKTSPAFLNFLPF